MPFRSTLTAATTAAALALTTAPVAIMTTQGAAAQETQDAQETQEYSAEQIDVFTGTLLDVADVRNKYTPALQSAENKDQQEAIIEEANAEIKAVIEAAEGLSMDQYIEIAQAASEDEALNARIVERVKKLDQANQ